MWPTYRQYACNHIKGEHFSSYFLRLKAKRKSYYVDIKGARSLLENAETS